MLSAAGESFLGLKLYLDPFLFSFIFCASCGAHREGSSGHVDVAIFAFAPISAVYYPVETLPSWLQLVAWCTPSAYVFEGMRSVLIDNIFRYDLLIGAIGVNVVYLFAGVVIFSWSFLGARKAGQLLQTGE